MLILLKCKMIQFINSLDSISVKKISKIIFKNVIFDSGEYLNLSLSNYPKINNDSTAQEGWDNIGEYVKDDIKLIEKNKSTKVFKSNGTGQKLPTIAIVNFEPRGSIVSSDVACLTDRFQQRLMHTNKYRIIEREQMNYILKEQGFQQSGACIDNECLVRIGQLIAVEKTIAGSISKVGDIHTISIKILDVETGEIEKSISEDCKCTIEFLLAETMERVANEIAGIKNESADTTSRSIGIFINTFPRNASVFINGKEGASTIPILVKNLNPGNYFVFTKKIIDGVEWNKHKVIKVTGDAISTYNDTLKKAVTELQVQTNVTGSKSISIKNQHEVIEQVIKHHVLKIVALWIP